MGPFGLAASSLGALASEIKRRFSIYTISKLIPCVIVNHVGGVILFVININL
jgi:hypothetical protein